MISIDLLVTQVSGLERDELEHWIAHQWVRPDGPPEAYSFHDIDVARVRLIRELRHELEVNEAAVPIILSLLDQLYELRRRVREVGALTAKR